MRVHGTTRLRPGEVFLADEHPQLTPLPDEPFDTPTWARPKVAPDRHVRSPRPSTASPVTSSANG